MQEVNCQTGNPLSVVQGTPGIEYLEFTVSATNTGDIPLTCTNLPASPTSFVTGMESIGSSFRSQFSKNEIQ